MLPHKDLLCLFWGTYFKCSPKSSSQIPNSHINLQQFHKWTTTWPLQLEVREWLFRALRPSQFQGPASLDLSTAISAQAPIISSWSTHILYGVPILLQSIHNSEAKEIALNKICQTPLLLSRAPCHMWKRIQASHSASINSSRSQGTLQAAVRYTQTHSFLLWP